VTDLKARSFAAARWKPGVCSVKQAPRLSWGWKPVDGTEVSWLYNLREPGCSDATFRVCHIQTFMLTLLKQSEQEINVFPGAQKPRMKHFYSHVPWGINFYLHLAPVFIISCLNPTGESFSTVCCVTHHLKVWACDVCQFIKQILLLFYLETWQTEVVNPAYHPALPRWGEALSPTGW